MPLLKGTAGKAMPDMAIGYITRKDKAKYIDVQNLFIDEDFVQTMLIRLGYKSMPKPMRKKPSLIASA